MRHADGEHAMDTEMQRIPHKVLDLPKGKREAFTHRDLLGSGKDYPKASHSNPAVTRSSECSLFTAARVPYTDDSSVSSSPTLALSPRQGERSKKQS
jgi:hypothetical protein